ncbi:glycosyltransferase [Actinoplanes sp. NPDC051859]|uniref:glycosyltransferase n=1 Tax=Actinoplanes sp. NPDC051859 TaxID=3363909 RepID=UPI0037AC5418
MRVLLAGPDHPQGSLPPYLDLFAAELRRLGTTVDRLGAPGVPYDPVRGDFLTAAELVAVADALATRIDPASYDLISLHFGNLEIEQLLVARWHHHGAALPPVVVHVHALDPTLVAVHRPDAALRVAVDATLVTAGGLVYFGRYAQQALAVRLPAVAARPARVAPLPTTITAGTRPAAGPALAAALTDPRPGTTVLSLCGYAAPWKSAADLIAALARTEARLRVVLAGPFWDDPCQAGIDLRPAVGQPMPLGVDAQLVVVADYLDAPERAALVAGSAAGVFPYRPQHTFQGSGAIADYLAYGRPVIAADVANMAELTADAGVIVAPGDPAALAAALDRYATDPGHRATLRTAAGNRAHQFTPAGHAAACLAFYQHVRSAQCRRLS